MLTRLLGNEVISRVHLMLSQVFIYLSELPRPTCKVTGKTQSPEASIAASLVRREMPILQFGAATAPTFRQRQV